MASQPKFSKEIIEYIKTRFESQSNITHLASELIGKFGLTDNPERIRRNVSNLLQREKMQKQTNEAH